MLNKNKLFVYGILMGTYEGRIDAKLNGYEHIVRGHASIVKKEGECVKGELVVLNDAQFEETDRIESVGHYYHRFKVKVETDIGLVEDVWVYQQIEDKEK